jgi:hypothetical protein
MWQQEFSWWVRTRVVKWHGSFLVRCWQRDTGPERIEIEHIQTGDKTLVTSLAKAAEWMASKSRGYSGSTGADQSVSSDASGK